MPSLRMDDSGHEDSTKVLVGAGYVASGEAWDAFEDEWSAIANGRTFHMAHLCGEVGRGQFKGWSLTERIEFVEAMGRVIGKHLKLGVARVIFVDDYKNLLVPLSDRFLTGTDAKRLAGIAWILRMTLEWLSLSWDDRPGDRKIEVIFEAGTKWLGESITYCRNLKRKYDWARVFGHIGSDSKENLISLQAADFLAYHVYQAFECQRTTSPYQQPQSFSLSVANGSVNVGRLPRENIPYMLQHFELTELFSDIS